MKSTVEVGNFAEVLDTSYVQYGIKKGDTVYVAGDVVVPVDKDDPYALRRMLIATTVVDGHIQTKDVKPFTIDGKRLVAVGKGKQAKLDRIKEQDFAPVEEEVSEATN